MGEELFLYLEPEYDNETVLEQPTILSSINDAISKMAKSKIQAILLATFFLMSAPSYSESLTEYADGFSIPTEQVYFADQSQSQLKDNLRKRIETLASISDQTSGDRAHRLTENVRYFSILLVEKVPEELLLGWTFFPDVNGALRLDFKDKDVVSCISIGEDGFSWFAQSESRFDMKDREELSVDEIISCMNTVHALIPS